MLGFTVVNGKVLAVLLTVLRNSLRGKNSCTQPKAAAVQIKYVYPTIYNLFETEYRKIDFSELRKEMLRKKPSNH